MEWLWQTDYLVSVKSKQAQVLQTPFANIQLFITAKNNQKLSFIMCERVA
jgi:hypothetical protein